MAIVEVIKYDGEQDILVWKYPSQELGTWTQLIVNESQEAILFKGGKALDLFESGRHTLSTANIPILNNIINLPFGGKTPFTAEVWYINKLYSLDIKWGTATPIQIQDPKYKVFIPLRSFGYFGIQIEDSRKFLIKLVGTLQVFDKATLVRYFRGIYLTRVKDTISAYLIHKGISALEINAYLSDISEYLSEKLAPVLEEYGIKLVNFSVNDINVPEDDSAVIKLKEALAKRAEMDIVGYSYVQERSFDTLEGAATNSGGGIGDLMGAGIGLGMGVGLGGNFGGQMSNMVRNVVSTDSTRRCISCECTIGESQKFCPQCGSSQEVKKEEEVLNGVQCASCGATIGVNNKFCPECGKAYNPCYYCKADLPIGSNRCHICNRTMPRSCPSCKTLIENENSKFCTECGESLVKRCSGCNREIDGIENFCPECGTKVE